MSKGLPRSMAHAPAGTEPSPRRVKYTVTNGSFTVAAAGAAAGLGTLVIGDLPEGNILVLGGISYFQFTTADTDFTATWDGSYSVGSDPDADGTLSGLEVNLITSSAIAAATDRVSPVTRGANATASVIDNTDGAKEVNLNLVVDAADVTDAQSGTFTVTGYVELVYIVLGDD